MATDSDPGRAIFGARYDTAQAYSRLLAEVAVEQGLLGPREADRVWDRHILNCVGITELIADDSTVVDIGSGAGLPAIPLALANPSLTVHAVESLSRRVAFLERCVDELALANVHVVHGRAEERAVVSALEGADVVTARAVARLDRLAETALPLLRPDGLLLAIKGERSDAELATYRRRIRKLGGVDAEVCRCGSGEPTTVVRIRRKPASTATESATERQS